MMADMILRIYFDNTDEENNVADMTLTSGSEESRAENFRILVGYIAGAAKERLVTVDGEVVYYDGGEEVS